jgi:hypothetical protein
VRMFCASVIDHCTRPSLPDRIKALVPQVSHLHCSTHTHTHTYTHIHTHSLSLSLCFTLSHSISHTHIHRHTLPLLTLSLSHTLSLSLNRSDVSHPDTGGVRAVLLTVPTLWGRYRCRYVLTRSYRLKETQLHICIHVCCHTTSTSYFLKNTVGLLHFLFYLWFVSKYLLILLSLLCCPYVDSLNTCVYVNKYMHTHIYTHSFPSPFPPRAHIYTHI